MIQLNAIRGSDIFIEEKTSNNKTFKTKTQEWYINTWMTYINRGMTHFITWVTTYQHISMKMYQYMNGIDQHTNDAYQHVNDIYQYMSDI